MSVLHHRMAVIGGKSYNRIPLKMLKAIPAGFPLAIHDDYFGVAGHSDAIFSNIQSAGEDLRAFTDEAMTASAEIPVDIIDITPGSNLLHAFVRVPLALAINDKIWLRTTVGGGETTPAVTDPSGRNNVWQDYAYSMNGIDLTIDRSGNLSAGTNSGGVAKSGGDLLNGWPCYGFGAREGTADTDYTLMPSVTSAATESWTVVCFKDATEDVTYGRLAQFAGIDWEFRKDNSNGGNNVGGRRKCSTTNQSFFTTGSDFTDGAWHVIGMTWPAVTNTPSMRLNGATPASNAVAGAGTMSFPTSDISMTGSSGFTWPLDGRIAEWRCRFDNTPDNAWFDLERDCFNNPASIAEAEALAVV